MIKKGVETVIGVLSFLSFSSVARTDYHSSDEGVVEDPTSGDVGDARTGMAISDSSEDR